MPPMLEQFITKRENQLVNFDGSPDSAGQAVQLIADWCTFIGLPFQWAQPADWWDDDDQTFSEHWRKVHRQPDSNKLPQPGDIVAFSSQLPGTDGGGHLSLFLDGNEHSAEWHGFDAAWGGLSAHRQSHNWAYVVGWFTPVFPAVLESRIPTPIAEPTAVDGFDLEPIEPQIITIAAEVAPLYNLNRVAWDTFVDEATASMQRGYTFEAGAIARHRLGGNFYVPVNSTAVGYAVTDCEGEPPRLHLTPAVEAEVLPDPEAAHESKFDGGAFAAPRLAPNRNDTIRLKEDTPAYRYTIDAANRANPTRALPPDVYYVYKRAPNGMINVTRNPGQSGHWINPQPEPEQPDWHTTYKQYGNPMYFAAKYDYMVVDLDGVLPEQKIVERQPILIAGNFTGPDGIMYAAPAVTVAKGQYYGIPVDVLRHIQTPVQTFAPEETEDIETHPTALHAGGVALALRVGATMRNIRRFIADSRKTNL